MGRKIVLLSDGTGNSAAKVWRTNVWRVFERIDLAHSDQIAFYDDGVGTAAFKPLAVLGGAFGYGLKRNVLDLYKFACRNHRQLDDEIYGFGFSRGAFTIRVVIGLILDQGLVKARSEAELNAKARAAYRAYRAKRFHTKWPSLLRPERLMRFLRDLILRSHYSDAENFKDVKIRFLGLWDTVAAYGMPIEEMARGMSQWIWPWMLPDCDLDTRVRRACHALSIDDERTTFHPTLWDESAEEPLAPQEDGKRYLAEERISQVWFPGSHSNVGGGYPDDSVAHIPLVWILSEAQACGLRFKAVPEANPQTFGYPTTAQDKDGRIYDPRKGLGSYYRYGPRDLRALGKELLSRNGTEMLPRIHESVLKRISNRAHSYAPLGLPARYEIVTADGQVLSPKENPYEHADQASARWHRQEQLWNRIWLRRAVYFMTAGVSFYLFAFPLIEPSEAHEEFVTKLRWVSEIVRTAGAFLPSGARPWLDGYARDPSQFVIVAAILAMMVLWSSWLAGKIYDQMGVIWQHSLAAKLADPGKPTDLIYRFRTSPLYVWGHRKLKTVVAPAVFAALFAYLGVALTSHALFNIQDHAGLVCTESIQESHMHMLRKNEIILANGKTRLLSEEELKNPFQHVKNLPVFKPSKLCQSLKVWLERNRRYLIRFESTASFADGTIEASKGFSSLKAPSLWQKALLVGALPLRRELFRPWFRVVARFGGTGGEGTFLDPDLSDERFMISETIKATRDGELFLFVNDAVVGIRGWYDVFYGNNGGETKVLVMGQ